MRHTLAILTSIEEHHFLHQTRIRSRIQGGTCKILVRSEHGGMHSVVV